MPDDFEKIMRAAFPDRELEKAARDDARQHILEARSHALRAVELYDEALEALKEKEDE